MSFLASNFLWLLPLISIPVILHIMNQSQIKNIDFSSLRFLRLIEHDSINRLKILQLILLILRTLIILLIILMISRPVISGFFSNYNNNSIYTAIIIDDTFSNHGYIEKENKWDIINNKFFKILENVNENSNVILYSLSNGIIYNGKKNLIPSGKLIISGTYYDGNIENGIQDIMDSIDRDYSNYELFIISDGQLSTFDNHELINKSFVWK